jgi:hypothetical protein
MVEGAGVGKPLPDLLVGQVLAKERRHGLPGSSPRINLKRVSLALPNTHASSRTGWAWQQFISVDTLQDDVGQLLRGYDAPTLQSLTSYAYLVEAINALCS